MAKFTQVHYRHFTEPQSVAIIGASSRTGPGTYNLLENLLGEKFPGELIPVNRRADTVLGLKAYSSVRDLPHKVDLAVVTVPRQFVVESVQDCVARGIDSVVVITQGFADADEQGAAWQEELIRVIAGTDTRIIGPNSIGLANAFSGFHTSFQRFDLRPRANAMICQSGMFVLASADFVTGLGIGVDIGNAADVGFAELLAEMAADDRIQVINLHLEGLPPGRELLDLAADVTRTKPVIAYKVGRSAEAARAAASHSGALAGDDEVVSVALDQAGVIRVADLDEMNDLNKALLTYPALAGRRIAVISLSGGGGIATLDALGQFGLEAAKPKAETISAIQAMNPDWLEVSNPVDSWMASLKLGLAQASREILRLLLADEAVDGVIILLNCYRATGFEVMGDMVAGIVDEASACRQKPVALWAFGLNQDEVIERAEQSGVVAGFTSPERAARALAGLYRYQHEIKPRQLESLPNFDDIRREKAASVISRAQEQDVTILGSETLEMLQAYGIPVAVATLAPDLDAARQVAETIGYPVVLKIASPQVIHKSDVGGVRLDITRPEALGAAYDKILTSVGVAQPEAEIHGVYVQPYRREGVEVILGARQTAQGPLILVGLGGIFTEVLGDVACGLAPLTARLARGMLHRLRCRPLLEGARGGVVVDQELLVDAICRVSRLMLSHPQITELDVNPVMASTKGLIAVDARAVLTACGRSAPFADAT